MSSPRIVLCRLLTALFVLGAGYAHAATIAITNISISTAGTSANDTGSRTRRITNAAITDSGESVTATLGSTVDGAARFAMAAETRAASGVLGTTANNYDANYTVSFDVVADPTVSWDLLISNTRIGRLLTGSGGGNGLADISGSTGLVNGSPVAGLSLSDVAGLTAENGTTPFNSTGSTTVSGTGSASYVLNFTWHADIDSTQGFFSAGDKAGVLVGDDIAYSETDSQINYPNAATRAAEGHFVSMTATVTQVVPEPSSIVLAVMAFGFGVCVYRRKK